MALSFADATGNLFNRLGKLGVLLKRVRDVQALVLPDITDTTTGIVAQYDDESDLQAMAGGSYIGTLGSLEGPASLAAAIARQTISRMVYRDNPQIKQTLTASKITNSISEVIRQMKLAGATVREISSLTMVPTTFTSTTNNTPGDAVINTSVRRPFDGALLENAFTEKLLITCTRDSYIGGAHTFNETFAVEGDGKRMDRFAFDWPGGSNCSVAAIAIDGDTDNGSGNLLTNSSFDNWTDDVPDYWSLDVGTAGTHISEETSVTFTGDSSMRLTGDAGGTLVSLTQPFGTNSGSTSALSKLTQYSFNVFLKRGADLVGTGEMVIELVNSAGTVINDAGGSPNVITFDLTGLTTDYTAYKGVFRTPIILSSGYKIRLRMTAALPDGVSIYLDKASLGKMTKLYMSGPYIAIHAGSIPSVRGDYADCQVTNGRGAAGTLDTFQTLFCRLFWPDVINKEYLLPSSSVPTISDTLIG